MTGATDPLAGREWPQRAAIVLGTLITFARALPYPLQLSWDDARFIANNPDVRHVSAAALVRMFSEVQFEAYHPLHLLSYWLDVPWFGLNAFAIHAVSLVLWTLAALLVYSLFRALQISAWAALAGTLFCVLHPAQVEAVSWASGRKDALALLLSAASLGAYVRARSLREPAAWLAFALYGLALLAKTTALPLPLFMLALDRLVRGSSWRAALTRLALPIGMAAAVGIGVLTIWQQNTMLRTTLGGPELAPLRLIATLGHQLLTAVWPARTAPMYASTSVARFDPTYAGVGLAYALACLAAWRTRRKHILAGLLGFGALLSPASNLVPLYFPWQDRYLSLPLLGLGLALAGLLDGVPDEKPATVGAKLRSSAAARKASATPLRLRGFLAAGALLSLALRTWQYEGVWRDEPTLWGHAVSTQYDAVYAWLKLGEVRRNAGDLEGAIKAYRGAVRVDPQRRLAHAALFEAVALRDERYAGKQTSLARELAQQYYERLGRSEALRELARLLIARGYVRSAELPMQVALFLDGLPDNGLEQAAQAALRAGLPTLAAFYARSTLREPSSQALKELRARLYFQVTP